MKIVHNNERLVLYLNKFLIKDLDFNNMNSLEAYFKDLFIRLKEIYGIKINGFYYVYVYIDDLYGVILEIEKDDIDFFEYDENDVDMHIVLENTSFLYEVEDIFEVKDLVKFIDIYMYKNSLFASIKDGINRESFMNLIETSNIIYKDTREILKYGKKLEI